LVAIEELVEAVAIILAMALVLCELSTCWGDDTRENVANH
jgi:hypothetical protein